MSLEAITIEGTLASTYTRNTMIVQYGQGSKRGRNMIVPFRDGEWAHDYKWFTGANLILEVMLKTTPSPEENLSGLLERFNRMVGTATIAGTHEFAGAVQAEVEMLRSPVQDGNNPNIFRFPLRNPKGTWQAVTATTTTGNSVTPAAITTLGDRPVDDFSILFPTTGTVTHTDSAGRAAAVTITAGAPANLTVDMGLRTITDSTGGNQDAYLTVTQPYWMRLEQNSTQAITATANHTFTWRSQWAV